MKDVVLGINPLLVTTPDPGRGIPQSHQKARTLSHQKSLVHRDAQKSEAMWRGRKTCRSQRGADEGPSAPLQPGARGSPHAPLPENTGKCLGGHSGHVPSPEPQRRKCSSLHTLEPSCPWGQGRPVRTVSTQGKAQFLWLELELKLKQRDFLNLSHLHKSAHVSGGYSPGCRALAAPQEATATALPFYACCREGWDSNHIGDTPPVALLECLLDMKLGSETAPAVSKPVPHPNTLAIRGESSGLESFRLHVPWCRVEFKALLLSKRNGKEFTTKKEREPEDVNPLRLHWPTGSGGVKAGL
ncbi:hypothetical protein CB1_002237005 [Camelus ferus]|nr:hypothetical protein CB1_002237005 [Camelus ferus]